ncbi:MAG: septum formation protein Maf [Planctomycetes bacterium]|nr:septum formation protein Maf [Planctomycetota bacterium]
MNRLVLASASPRRADLMRREGYSFEVIEPPLHEPDRFAGGLSATEQAEASSYFKARSVASRLTSPALVIGADTVVLLKDEVFGKPSDVHDARRILSSLADTTHRVITGLTVLDSRTDRRIIVHDTTIVTMRPMPEPAMEQYLTGGAWRGKAGAYGIQDEGDAFIERIDGSFENVMGLPTELLAEVLSYWEVGRQPGSSPAREGSARR